MDIAGLVYRKQQEADTIFAAIAEKEVELAAKQAVVDRLSELQAQSMFSSADMAFLFEEFQN